MTALEILVQQLDEKIGQLKDVVITGNFEVFEEYKRTCGEIRGLLVARGYVLDLKDRLEKADDE
jgi:hypothetical protein|tara:strand:+ start:1335 stop:1526 length:192 start_codon:yes stop_codon:yes gene_type:complete